MTHGDTHEHENNKVFSYQRTGEEEGYYIAGVSGGKGHGGGRRWKSII